jgi:hypothetical protein
MQGISSILAQGRVKWRKKGLRSQWLTGQFPTHPSSEFFAPLQGIKSGDQENFRTDQKILSAVMVFSCN